MTDLVDIIEMRVQVPAGALDDDDRAPLGEYLMAAAQLYLERKRNGLSVDLDVTPQEEGPAWEWPKPEPDDGWLGNDGRGGALDVLDDAWVEALERRGGATQILPKLVHNHPEEAAVALEAEGFDVTRSRPYGVTGEH